MIDKIGKFEKLISKENKTFGGKCIDHFNSLGLEKIKIQTGKYNGEIKGEKTLKTISNHPGLETIKYLIKTHHLTKTSFKISLDKDFYINLTKSKNQKTLKIKTNFFTSGPKEGFELYSILYQEAKRAYENLI